VSIAASALQRRGVPAGELPRHIIAVNVGEIVTVISRTERNGKAPGNGLWRRASGYCWDQMFPLTR
jgi:hypothetical protein